MQPSDDHRVLNAVMDAAIDAIIISNEAGIILRANEAASGLFGHSLDRLIGSPIGLLMPEEMRKLHEHYVERYLTSGDARVVGRGREVEALHSDGTVVPVHIALGKAEVNGSVAFVAMMHDLTRRRAAEEAAARSQRMDAIGRMTGGIAHDFNNLLTVVIGNLELLDAQVMPSNADQLIADALAAAELGADLTSQLMMFARKRPLLTGQIDLNEGLSKAVALLKHTIGAQCQIEVSLGKDLWTVNADATQLQTAILNLALNSQDAMPNGGRIFLETGNVEIDDTYLAQELEVEPGRYVRLSISDTGEGMTKAQRALALEPFFTTKTVGKGTGLGLSMVYGFTKQSGGHVALYSEPGEGTTVSLYFPAAENTQQMAAAGVVQSRLAETQHGAGHTILIVEDDPRISRLSETRLSALGFQCICAPNADIAWKIVQSNMDIALVFTDMVMPGSMTGYDLASKMAVEFPDLPVLITSGFSESVLQDKNIGAGVPILRKPYRQADLVEAVFDALGRD